MVQISTVRSGNFCSADSSVFIAICRDRHRAKMCRLSSKPLSKIITAVLSVPFHRRRWFKMCVRHCSQQHLNHLLRIGFPVHSRRFHSVFPRTNCHQKLSFILLNHRSGTPRETPTVIQAPPETRVQYVSQSTTVYIKPNLTI